MSITTVLGEIRPQDLGLTLPHEHLFLDLRNQFIEPRDPERRRRSREQVQLSNVGILRRNPYAVEDNLLIDDVDICVDEVNRFKELGGRTIVDCTSIGLKRDPQKLREVASRTGLNIIAGCGYYTQDTHPDELAAASAEEIAERIVGDLTEGIDGTGIRSGVIGEIGTGAPIHPDERKVLLGAAIAHRQVPAAIHVHCYPWICHAKEAVDLLIESGVDPAKIVVNHLDADPDLPYLRDLLERGIFVEFDEFGKEMPVDSGDEAFAAGRFATDGERAVALREILGWGYARQLLITNDLCFKTMLCAYGGWGYGHVHEHIVPLLGRLGVDQQTIDIMTIENPARLLDT